MTKSDDSKADIGRASSDHPEGGPPSRIGSYRILDLLGEGGMAEVYLAEQSEPVKRRVALKILKAGMDSKQVVARFESERQALAVLDHPNIAKVFDGGIAESGRPYFVMEQVKGIAITDYCDDRRLSNKDRLALFIKVCSAVQHAHLKGLIHRDIKPSNILIGEVDGVPEPRIIDFGIAKATSTTLTEATLHTRIGQIIGTPQYMSPEQAGVTGLDVDTRTDIYSLGVVLYELLVGTVPLDLQAIGDPAIQVAMREKDPLKPSTRLTELGDTREEIARVRSTDVQGLRRQLKGDLDWIVMRAIEKDRNRRYETANALAMECRRFLNNEPVLARSPSTGYLLQRFVRRNRLTVLAGSVAILAIVAGAVASTLGYIRATDAEKLALQEAETAKQVSDFLVELFEVSDPSEARGNTVTAREVLDRGAERVRNELSSQPGVQARLMLTMGGVYVGLGLYDEARSLLTDAMEKTQSFYGGESLEASRVMYRLAVVHRRLRDLDAAEPLFRRSIEIREGILGPNDNTLAPALSSFAILQIRREEYDDAEHLLLRALEIFEAAPDSNDSGLANVLNNIGGLYVMQGRQRDALPHLERSLAIRKIGLGPNHPSVAESQHNLAVVYLDLDDYESAESWERQSLEIKQSILEPDHPHLALSQHNYANILVQLNRYDEAESLFRKVLESQERSLGATHPERLETLESYVDLLRATGREKEADAISIREVLED